MIHETFTPDQELFDFATIFSEKYKILSAGTTAIPNVYTSEFGKYRINYFDTDYVSEEEYFPYGKPTDEHSDIDNEEIIPEPPKSKNPCRIASETGIMEFAKKRIISAEFTPDHVFYLVLWCVVCKAVDGDYSKADIITLDYYKTTGKSIKNIFLGWISVFSGTPTIQNKERYMNLMLFAEANNLVKKLSK